MLVCGVFFVVFWWFLVVFWCFFGGLWWIFVVFWWFLVVLGVFSEFRCFRSIFANFKPIFQSGDLFSLKTAETITVFSSKKGVTAIRMRAVQSTQANV